MLTNFKTMRGRVDRLNQLKKMQEDGTFDMLPKKEVMKHLGEIEKLEKYLGGVKDMKKLPGALFIVDTRKERNAIAEAHKLGIPVVVTPGANNRSVAEHAITLMLALSKNMVESDVEQRKGNWKIRDAKKAFEVEKKTCLIIGLGTIGKIIAHGDTREQAIARMRVALSELAVEGIKTNTKLHRELLADERFFQGGTLSLIHI